MWGKFCAGILFWSNCRNTFRLATLLKVRLQQGRFSKTLELTVHIQKGLTSAPFYDKIETCVPQEEATTVGVLKKGALFPTQYCHILSFSCFRSTKEFPWNSRSKYEATVFLQHIYNFKNQFSTPAHLQMSHENEFLSCKKGTRN